MYFVSIIALIAVMLFVNVFSTGGMQLAWYLDLPSLILLIIICVPFLVSAGLLRDFNNAFRFVVAKKKAKSLLELKRAQEAVSLAMITLLVAGTFIFFLTLIFILVKLDDPLLLGPNIAVALLEVVYATAFSLLLLPLRAQMKVKILEFLERDEEEISA